MSKKWITGAGTVAAFILSPLVALADFAPGNPPTQLTSLTITGLVNLLFTDFLWPVAVAFFIVMFVVAAFTFFTARGEPEALKKARDFVIWGVVGVVVAVLAFSIPFIIRNLVGA